MPMRLGTVVASCLGCIAILFFTNVAFLFFHAGRTTPPFVPKAFARLVLPHHAGARPGKRTASVDAVHAPQGAAIPRSKGRKAKRAKLRRDAEIADALHALEQKLHGKAKAPKPKPGEHSPEVKGAVLSATTPEERVLHLCTDRRRAALSSIGAQKTPLENDEGYKGTVRVMQYNVYDGIENGQRREWIGQWVREQRIDVLTLNELNGWTDEYLADIALAWGFSHSELLDTKGYNMGIMSKFKITPLAKTVGGTFHHGFLHVRIEHPTHPFRCVVTHLSPFESSKRVMEAQSLVVAADGERLPVRTLYVQVSGGPRVTISLSAMGELTSVYAVKHSLHGVLADTPGKRAWALFHGKQRMDDPDALGLYDVCDGDTLDLRDPGAPLPPSGVLDYSARAPSVLGNYTGDEPLLIMGDLNSLSPVDGAAYESTGLLQHLLAIKEKDAEERIVKKFLRKVNGLRPGYGIDFEPIKAFLSVGFTDYLGEAGRNDHVFHHTVPTMLQLDYMHAARMRLDYILGNPAFQKQFGPCTRAHTVQSACTEILSDHLPVVLTFRPGASGRQCNIPHESNASACSWKTLCSWRNDWEEKRLLRIAEREQICDLRRAQWRHEEGTGRDGPSLAEWPFAVRAAKKGGLACRDVCRGMDRNELDQFHQSLTVGGQATSEFCIAPKLPVLNTCDRLKVSFDCLHGCHPVEGPDQPSFVSANNDKYYGYCLLNPPKKNGTCAGHHYSTNRLCPCGRATWSVVKGAAGESCSSACRRERPGSVCIPPLVRELDNCQVMATAFGCKQCERMVGVDLPAYVSNKDSGMYGKCLVNDLEKLRPGQDPPAFCEGKHPDTTRLCPCARVDAGQPVPKGDDGAC